MYPTLPDWTQTLRLAAIVVPALVALVAVWRFGRTTSAHRMRMSLALATALFWGPFAVALLWGFWDSYYRYFYDEWSRGLAWTAAFFYVAVGQGMWWLASHLPGNRVLNFLLLGGVESVPEHVLGIYVLRILDRVPDLQGLSPGFIFFFAFFEYIVYWGIVLALAILIQRFFERRLNRNTGTT